jgi:proteasome accessory factor A
MCEFASFLKIGSAQAVLAMLEDNFVKDDFSLNDPVEAVKIVSADYKRPLELANGRKMTAVEIQRELLGQAEDYFRRHGERAVPDAEHIVKCWEEALDGLEELVLSKDMVVEDDPSEMTGKLDWVLKLWLINRARIAKKLKWDDPRIKVLDLKYHNIDESEGIFYHLQDREVAERLLEDTDIETLVARPPEDTRAYFRGKCIEKYPGEINFVNWEVVGFDQGDVYRMVPLMNPMKGTRDRFERIFEECENAAELIAAITA